jgi:tetratricopeptide (TPR) repeat protein
MNITLAEKEQFVSSPPRFQLDPPGESPFEAIPSALVISSKGSYQFDWIENQNEQRNPKGGTLFDAIVSKSRIEAERSPSNPHVRANYALALMNSGNLLAAAKEFEAVLEKSPQHFMSLANLARIRSFQERFNDAELLYEKLMSLYPKELSPLVNLSYVLFRIGKLDRAAAILNQAIELDPDAAFPRYLMAVSDLKLSRPQDAIKHLRVAVRADVRSPATYQTLGVAYMMAGDSRAAARAFKTALSLAPDMREGVHSLANVLRQEEKIDELIEVLSVYLLRQPADIQAREILSDAYSQNKQYPFARLQLTEALRYVVGDDEHSRQLRARLLNNIGVCFDRLGDIDNTIIWVQKSVTTDQKSYSIPHLNLARLHLRKRQFGLALQALDTCRKFFPQNRQIPEVHASILVEQERQDEAINLLRDVVASGKTTAAIYANLGFYLANFNERWDEACQVMSEGLNLYPNSPEIINNLAYVQLMSGRPVEARKTLAMIEIDAKNVKPENRVALTATWGLLHLWEGELALGKDYYIRAEQLAREMNRKDLVPTVRQKMHLELAKAFLRHHLLVDAQAEIANGLSIKDGRPDFARELLSLADNTSTSSHD